MEPEDGGNGGAMVRLLGRLRRRGPRRRLLPYNTVSSYGRSAWPLTVDWRALLLAAAAIAWIVTGGLR